jgi:prepilin-type N-terminal cleavage/methylation domain-containing protein
MVRRRNLLHRTHEQFQRTHDQIQRKHNAHRLGFTLIEMAIVLGIIALLFGMVTLSFREPLQRAQFQSAIERIVDFDNRARRGAESMGFPGQITVDLDRGSLHATRWVESTAKEIAFRLPQGIRIEQVLTAENWIEDGSLIVPVDSIGASNTYAVRVAGPSQVRWVLFMGGTGQHLVLESDNEIKQIFSRFFAARIDAD